MAKKKKFIVQCKLRNTEASGSSCGSRWKQIPLDGGQSYWYTVLWLKEKHVKPGNVVPVAHPDTGKAEEGWEIVEIWGRKELKEEKKK